MKDETTLAEREAKERAERRAARAWEAISEIHSLAQSGAWLDCAARLPGATYLVRNAAGLRD